jgi:atypical dual specificity phosphatase
MLPPTPPAATTRDRRWSNADVDGEARTRRMRDKREARCATNGLEVTLEEGGAENLVGTVRTRDATTKDDAAPSVLQKLQKWGDYASFGDVVEGTRLIPMKTPLSERYVDGAYEHVLTVEGLIREQMAFGRRIGLIIDLTNHDCLYEDDIPANVRRVHVRNVAKTVPSAADARKAAEAVERYQAEGGRDHVAVHCAYGFNRTGFIICSMMIETLGLSPAEAMDRFAASRPPGLKHEHFRRELVERYARRSDPGSDLDGATRLLSRSFGSEPDMRTEEDRDENESLDIDMNRKFHWRPGGASSNDG